jgi:hypothetical protein
MVLEACCAIISANKIGAGNGGEYYGNISAKFKQKAFITLCLPS